MNADEAVSLMLDRSDAFAYDCAEAIARMEGWRSQGDPSAALKHIRRMLRAEDNRGFKYRWAPVVARFAVFHDVPNLLLAPIDDATRDAEYELRQREREDMPARPGLRTVRPDTPKWGRAAYRSAAV